ncbi:hypothetical protein NPIL_189791 [Nephila pilipes]|uniref:Uncharacterized protein n=1 Tax=Nephila pilipes TaxID=299642 RepID=A0A8X6U479_NEPPI|nr:hypothetical protein NPIL_189791 [Nephila pilipes]
MHLGNGRGGPIVCLSFLFKNRDLLNDSDPCIPRHASGTDESALYTGAGGMQQTSLVMIDWRDRDWNRKREEQTIFFSWISLLICAIVRTERQRWS